MEGASEGEVVGGAEGIALGGYCISAGVVETVVVTVVVWRLGDPRLAAFDTKLA
jgi:hypothetical protein